MAPTAVKGTPSPLQFEHAGLNCWPGLLTEWDGQWVRRSARGLTKRANSAQCFSVDDDDDVHRRVGEVMNWFARQALPPVFRINPLTGPNLIAELDRRGFGQIDHSHLFAMPLNAAEPAMGGEIVPVLAPAFLETQRRLKGYSEGEMKTFTRMLSVLPARAAGVLLHDAAGKIVSSGLMAISDGIVIAGNVVTDPVARRQGHAAAMMRTGLAWAYAEGAAFAALNVAADNPPALALYTGLGYQRQYDYSYRLAPEAEAT